MIRIAVNGALGRMGRTVGRLALEDASVKLVAALESAPPAQDYGTLLGRDPIGLKLSAALPAGCDVLVDFSTPEASMARLEECAKRKTAHLICTTGLAEAQRAEIAKAAKKIPVLLASNTSVGVAALGAVVADLARMLGPAFDVEIVEMHHRLKKDAPSGTAITLGEAVAGASGRSYPGDFNFGRRGNVGARPAREIGMHALRGGGVVGDHSVIFASDDEVITVSHRAGSRDLFARGALRAAAWLAGRKPGNYSMRDVIAGSPRA